MPAPILDREEYVEQAYFFQALEARMEEHEASQDLMASLRDEILATTKLPLAIDFLVAELRHTGVMGPAMTRLDHYFTAFQSHVVLEAEKERGRFDLRTGLEILRREASYRSEDPTPQGIFLFQFETLCRHRLGYALGLAAMAADPLYGDAWREWILTVRRQVGMVDIADLIYVRSAHYQTQQSRRGQSVDEGHLALFGEKEGKIALANRTKDPLWLFAALERHLGYPTVPRPRKPDKSVHALPLLEQRVERLESRLRLLEEEQRGGIDISRFYAPKGESRPPDAPG